MGSIMNPVNPSEKTPDYIHFANWRRLNNARWKLRYSAGRSFDNDSAVCYIYEPALLPAGSFFTYTIFLTTEDIPWYNSVVRQPRTAESQVLPQNTPTIDIEALERNAIIEAAQNNENADTRILLMLQNLLNQFIAGEIFLNEQDLMEIENAINRHR
jgi:hypothetical protein